jgi:glycosyltransferase involved in cell wall biosynthesis
MRYSTAGFPTKVVESLASGTPVICNITSDLGEHLVDGREAIICPDRSRASLIAAFERAMLLSSEERHRMRLAARRRAEEAFDYRNFTETMGDFLARAVEERR